MADYEKITIRYHFLIFFILNSIEIIRKHRNDKSSKTKYLIIFSLLSILFSIDWSEIVMSGTPWRNGSFYGEYSAVKTNGQSRARNHLLLLRSSTSMIAKIMPSSTKLLHVVFSAIVLSRHYPKLYSNRYQILYADQ